MYEHLAGSSGVEEFFEYARLLTGLQFFLNCGVPKKLTWIDATCTGLAPKTTRFFWAASIFKAELTMSTNSSLGERCNSENPFKHRWIVQTDKQLVV